MLNAPTYPCMFPGTVLSEGFGMTFATRRESSFAPAWGFECEVAKPDSDSSADKSMNPSPQNFEGLHSLLHQQVYDFSPTLPKKQRAAAHCPLFTVESPLEPSA